MIVNVRLLGVPVFLITRAVIMTVLEGRMVVLMRVPVRAMIPFAAQAGLVVVRDMVVVVHVHRRGMQMLWFSPVPVGALLH